MWSSFPCGHKFLLLGWHFHRPTERNFFSGLEIYFKGLEIYFSALEIYFKATEIVLLRAAKKLMLRGQRFCSAERRKTLGMLFRIKHQAIWREAPGYLWISARLFVDKHQTIWREAPGYLGISARLSVRGAWTNLLCCREFLLEFYLAEREIIRNFVGENAINKSNIT